MKTDKLSWTTTTIAEIASVKTGPFGSALHESDYVLSGTPIVTVEHLSERGIQHNNLPLVGGEDVKRLSSYICRTGDILFSRVGSIDRNSLVSTKENGWLFSGRLLRVRADSQRVHAPFLSYVFSTLDFKNSVKSVAVGQTMPSLNTKLLGGLRVSFPNLEEQQATAEILGDVDALITELERLIAKKKEIKQGVMQELLTGKTRLPGFTDEWGKTTLGEICKIKTGKRNNQDKREGALYPFFVRSASVERIDTYSYDCEAILVPGEGNIGSIFHYIKGKFEVHQRVYKISDFIDSVSGKFVFYVMSQFFGVHAMENSVKATVDSLRLPTFNSFGFSLPTSRDEQEQIVVLLDEVEEEIVALERQLSSTRLIKQGMMQELLTGRTLLIPSGE